MTAIPAPSWPFRVPRIPSPRRAFRKVGRLFVPDNRIMAAGDQLIDSNGNVLIDADGNRVVKDASDACSECCGGCCTPSCNCCYSPNSSWTVTVNTADSTGQFDVPDEICEAIEGTTVCNMVDCEPTIGWRDPTEPCAFSSYLLFWTSDTLLEEEVGGVTYRWALYLGAGIGGIYDNASSCAARGDTVGDCSPNKYIGIAQFALQSPFDEDDPTNWCIVFTCERWVPGETANTENQHCWHSSEFDPDWEGPLTKWCCGSADAGTEVYADYNGPYCCKEPESAYGVGCRSATEAETEDCGFCDEGI